MLRYFVNSCEDHAAHVIEKDGNESVEIIIHA